MLLHRLSVELVKAVLKVLESHSIVLEILVQKKQLLQRNSFTWENMMCNSCWMLKLNVDILMTCLWDTSIQKCVDYFFFVHFYTAR